MMIHIGIIPAEAKGNFEWPAQWHGNWELVERSGNTYAKITSFRHYFTDEVISQLDAVFSSEGEYEQWVNSDILYLAKSWPSEFADYKQAKEHLRGIVAQKGGFEVLASEEQRIVASWFATTPENINSVLTLDEQIEADLISDSRTKEARVKRYSALFSLFKLSLTTMEAMQVASAIDNNKVAKMYLELGFEGDGTVNYKGEPDLPGIVDFLKGQSIYETTGLPSMNLTPLHGLTMIELINRGVSIIKYGY